MSDRPRLFDDFLPIHDALCIEFARKELTDDKLAETVAGWSE